MTRIIAGTYGGRRLATPTGPDTRPTSDRVREALFSALDATHVLYGRRFLDLYAGTGAVGLEAASRGAEHVLLVESDPKAGRVIRENIAASSAGAARGRHARRPAAVRRPRSAGGPDRRRATTSCSPIRRTTLGERGRDRDAATRSSDTAG